MTTATRGTPWLVAIWAPPALLVLIPLIAMQLSSEWNWSPGDFLFAALLGTAVGACYEIATRISGSRAYRAATALALLTGFALLWTNLAVGIIGGENSPANLLFGGVLVIAAIGAAVSRLRPLGMSRAILAAGIAQAALAVLAPLSLLFTLGWLGSAWLYRTAANA